MDRDDSRQKIQAAVKRIPATRPQRICIQFLVWLALLLFFVDTVAAANGLTLAKGSRDTLAVPQWLYLTTGGATIGASALLASFVTDRVFIRSVHEWSQTVPAVDSWWQPLVWAGRAVGVIGLGLAVYVGLTGPPLPTSSLTILLAFAGIRAGLPIVTYLFGNVWPVLNPWRTLATVCPSGFRTYPETLHRWPAVVGWLSLIWVEMVFPVSTVPSVLTRVLLVYSTVTLAGAILFGPEPWFENADPLAVLFRFYGAVAAVSRSQGHLNVKLPGSRLSDSDTVTHVSDIAFIIALVWELTYSGFITTSAGAATIEALVGALAGLAGPETLAVPMYTLLFLVGYGLFFAAYWYASHLSRRSTNTYITARTIALQFAAPLLAIAAGYHLAHYAGLFVSLSPALVMALTSPLSPPANPLVLSPPPWFEGLGIAAILLGHLLAIWAAHAVAYDLFSSRLVAVRSQYPFIAVMVGYTVISLWIVSLPSATPPFLA
ncbi:hypothetical protein [Haloarcula laminariae]|uniref:hypothetical protein n=1 Tax=Haloarcula laminariae TaxID=2961577 RepID=UPI0021C5BF56|nr:hypothetical protein [Halomicroarcula laminariae]